MSITDDKAEAFEFLNELRESGTINMFGAGPILAFEFGLDNNEARSILREWMESYELN